MIDKRIPFNSDAERRILAAVLHSALPLADPYPSPCPDCAVASGDLHQLGCDIEQCPVHQGQLLACPDDCELSARAWSLGWASDSTATPISAGATATAGDCGDVRGRET